VPTSETTPAPQTLATSGRRKGARGPEVTAEDYDEAQSGCAIPSDFHGVFLW
jgi:hypothetical protein